VSEWTISSTELRIERGNLADQSDGVIAVDVDVDWTPAGPASGAILSEGGNPVREQISSLAAADPGTTRTIDPGELPAEQIVLVTMANESEFEAPETWIRDTYKRILNVVRDEGYTELSLPPLGLGDFGWSIDRTTTACLETIRDDLSGESEIERINLVVFDAIEYSSVENFADEILGDEQSEPDAEQRLRDYY
jgi:O-acetyl-ADP-ribose deacetylase (regulator of RNase III)